MTEWAPGEAETLEAPAEATGGDESPGAVLARREHVADALQLRQYLILGAIAWSAFGPVDVAVGLLLEPSEVPTLLVIRYLLLVLFLPLLWRSRRPPLPSDGLLRVLDAGPSIAVAVAVSIQCAVLGGLESVLAPGVIVAVLVRGALLHQPWQRSLPVIAAMVLSYPGVLLVAAAMNPAIEAQLHQSAALAHALAMLVFLLGSGGVALASSHTFWRVRRQALDKHAVGPYLLERPLGSGGMGDVWSARKFGRTDSVALKLLRPSATGLERALMRFEREIAALAALRHPNTVRIMDYGVSENGVWYYAMELIQGEDLEDRIDRLGALPEAEARAIGEQVSSALAEAHAAGIVHRDVKPSNIRLQDARIDSLKLLDFGIAHLAHDDGMTATGAVIGTPAYMAPEAARGDAVDARTDVYSVGATLYHALAGEPPYDAASSVGILTKVLAGPPEPLSAVCTGTVDEALVTLIERAMSHDPAARPADCGELLRELQSLDEAR